MADLPEKELAMPRRKCPGRCWEVPLVLFLMFVTAAVRAVAVSVTYCVSKDSVGYMNLAQLLRERDFAAFFENTQHHLFPVLLFVAQEFLGTSLFAAQMVNVMLGTLAVVPFYLLARDVFGVKAAAAAALLFAFHVVIATSAATVATDPLYLLAFLWALYTGRRSLDGGGPFLFVLTGFFLGIAFMTRAEGLGLAVVLCAWMLALGLLRIVGGALFARRYDPSGPRLLRGLVLATVAACMTISPHLLEGRLVEGKWRLTRRHAVSELVRGEKEIPPSRIVELAKRSHRARVQYWFQCLDELADESVWGYHLVSLLPLFYVLGIVCRRSQPREVFGELVLASVAVAYLGAVFWFRKVYGFMTERYLISSAVVILLWAGPGFLVASRLAARGLARWVGEGRAPVRVVAVILMLVTLGTMSLKTLKPLRHDKSYVRKLGERVRQEFPPSEGRATMVASFGLPRLIFYAGGRQVDLALRFGIFTGSPEQICQSVLQWGRINKAQLLMLQLKDAESPDAKIHSVLERKDVSPALALDYQEGRRKGTVLIYRFADLPQMGEAVVGAQNKE